MQAHSSLCCHLQICALHHMHGLFPIHGEQVHFLPCPNFSDCTLHVCGQSSLLKCHHPSKFPTPSSTLCLALALHYLSHLPIYTAHLANDTHHNLATVDFVTLKASCKIIEEHGGNGDYINSATSCILPFLHWCWGAANKSPCQFFLKFSQKTKSSRTLPFLGTLSASSLG